jgi:hypothetical protein
MRQTIKAARAHTLRPYAAGYDPRRVGPVQRRLYPAGGVGTYGESIGAHRAGAAARLHHGAPLGR